MKSNFISNLILLILIFTFAGCQQSKIELDSVQYYKDQQYEKAFPLLKEDSKKGNAEAQFYLGEMYSKGHFTKKISRSK